MCHVSHTMGMQQLSSRHGAPSTRRPATINDGSAKMRHVVVVIVAIILAQVTGICRFASANAEVAVVEDCPMAEAYASSSKHSSRSAANYGCDKVVVRFSLLEFGADDLESSTSIRFIVTRVREALRQVYFVAIPDGSSSFIDSISTLHMDGSALNYINITATLNFGNGALDPPDVGRIGGFFGHYISSSLLSHGGRSLLESQSATGFFIVELRALIPPPPASFEGTGNSTSKSDCLTLLKSIVNAALGHFPQEPMELPSPATLEGLDITAYTGSELSSRFLVRLPLDDEPKKVFKAALEYCAGQLTNHTWQLRLKKMKRIPREKSARHRSMLQQINNAAETSNPLSRYLSSTGLGKNKVDLGNVLCFTPCLSIGAGQGGNLRPNHSTSQKLSALASVKHNDNEQAKSAWTMSLNKGSSANQHIKQEHYEELGLILFIDHNAHKVSAFQVANLLAKTTRMSHDNGASSSGYSPGVILSSEGGHSSSSVSGGQSSSPGSVSIISSSDDDSDTSWSSASSVQQDSAGQTSNYGSSEQSFSIISSDNAAHLSSSHLMVWTSSSGQSTGDASGNSIEEKQDVSSPGNSAELLSSAAADDTSDIGSVTASSLSDNIIRSSSNDAHQGSGDEPHDSSSQFSDELQSAIDTTDSQDQDPASHVSSILSDDPISSETGLDAKSPVASISDINSTDDETSSSSSILSSSTLTMASSLAAQDYSEASVASSTATSGRTETESQSESVTSADEWSSSELQLTAIRVNSSSDSSININSTGFSSEFSSNGTDDNMPTVIDSADELSSEYYYSSGSRSTDDRVDGNPPSSLQSDETSPMSDYHILSSGDASDVPSSYQQASDESSLSASGSVLSSTVPSSVASNGVSSFETEGSSMLRSTEAASLSSGDASDENYQSGDTSVDGMDKSSQDRSSGSSNGLLTPPSGASGEPSGVSIVSSSNVDNAYMSSTTAGTASSQVSSAESSHLQSADDDESAADDDDSTASSGDDLMAFQRAASTSSSLRQSTIQFDLIADESDQQAKIARGNSSESIGVAGKLRRGEKDDDVVMNLGEEPLETDDTMLGTPTMRTNDGREASGRIKSGRDDHQHQEFKFRPIFFTVMLSNTSSQTMENGSPSALTDAYAGAFSWEYAKNLSIAVVDLGIDPIVSVLVLRLRTPDDGEPYSVIVDTLVRTRTSKGSRNLEDVLRQSPASLFSQITQKEVLVSNILTNPADIIKWGNAEFYSNGVSNRADSEGEVAEGNPRAESTWQAAAAASLPPDMPPISGGVHELPTINLGTPQTNKAGSATCRRELQARDGTCCLWPMVLDKSRNCCDRDHLDECQLCGGNGDECTLMPHQGNVQHDGDINETFRNLHTTAPSELLPRRLAAPLAPGLRVMDLLAGTALPSLKRSVANAVKLEKTPTDLHNPDTAVQHVTPDGDDDKCNNGAITGCEVKPSITDEPMGLDDSQARRSQDLLSCSGENCPDTDNRHQRPPPVDDGCPTGSPGDTAGDPAKSCVGNGVCSLVTRSCSCHIGFTASNCGQCAPNFVPFAGGCVPAALLTSRSGGMNSSYYSTSSGSLSSWLRDKDKKPNDELGHHQDAASGAKASSSGRGQLREILKFRNLAITLACIAASAAAFVVAAYAILIRIRRSAESADDDEHHHASLSVGIEQHQQDLA